MLEDPLSWIEGALASWDELGLRRNRMVRSSAQGARINWNGRSLLNFGSNDYLDLAGRCLTAAAGSALGDAGWGSAASPLVTGRGALHAELERRIAEFEGTESALLFPSGYAANVGAITALVGSGDAILSDAHNHASIIDGCRLSGAMIRIYAHADEGDLARGLHECAGARRMLVVTDSLFSMGGDFAPLDRIVELARRAGAMVMVDEAHATGVFGEHGRGLIEHLGVESDIHIRVGTLSKAIGSMGGFVAGTSSLIEWLVNKSRPYIFSTAFPEAAAAAALAALTIIQDEPQRRTRLLDQAESLRAALRDQGWRIGKSQSQIIPILIGESAIALQRSDQLRDRGLLVPAIRPPSVPAGESLLRISLTAGHDQPMVDELLAALETRRGGEKERGR